MSEANAEDGLFSLGRTYDMMDENNISNLIFGFLFPVPNSPKQTETKSRPHSFPDPSLRARNQPRQGEAKPQRIMFRPAESFSLIFQVRILLEKGSDFIQIRQPKSKVTVFGKNTRVASRQCFRLSEEKPRVFKIQKQGARREAGVPWRIHQSK